MPYKDPQREKEFQKQYKQDHKEERNAKTVCGCGGSFSSKSRASHFRTDKHQAFEALAKLEFTEN
jgi:hypothetical protein